MEKTGAYHTLFEGIAKDKLLDLYWHVLDENCPVFLLNETGKITYANEIFCSVTGYSINELPEFFFGLIQKDAHYQGFVNELFDLTKTDKAWKRKLCLKTKEEKTLSSEAMFYPWPGQEVSIQHLVVLFPESNHAIQKEEPKTFDKQEISGLAHDLRNPLYNISAICSLLLDSKLDNQQLEFVRKLKHTSSMLSGMIEDMLLYCIGGEMKLKPVITPFNLRQTAENFHLNFAHQAKEKGIKTSVEAEADLPEQVYGDSRRLNQIIIYLSEYLLSLPETEAIRITTMIDEIKEDQFEVSFFIHGQFGARELEKTATQHFNNQKPILSLEKARKNIDLLKGRVLLDGQQGKGFYYHFSLNFYKKPPTEAKPASKTDKATVADFPENPKVLVAEDVELNQMVMKHQLKKIGIDADFVKTGFNVLEKINSYRYDLIIMDAQMPGLNGLQTIEAIRSDESSANKNIPIISISASIGGNARIKCIEAGANDFVPKPYEVEDLKNKMKILIADYRKKYGKIMENSTKKSELDNVVLFDLEYLQEISDGDKEFSATMITYFIENTPGVLENLKERVQSKEWEEVRQIAHKLKPQVVYMGIHAIENDVELIEQNANKKENLGQIPAMFERTEEICLKAIEQLKEELKKFE